MNFLIGLDTARKHQEIDDDDKEDDVITKVRLALESRLYHVCEKE